MSGLLDQFVAWVSAHPAAANALAALGTLGLAAILYVAGAFKWLFAKPAATTPVVVQQPPPIPPGAAGVMTLTLEAYEALRQQRGEEITARLAGASEEDRARLASEKTELASRLADIETSYAKAQETITGLRETAERYGSAIGAEKLEAARRIFDTGDFDAADSLFARVEDAGDLEVKRTAAAAFQRGKIAEEQVRWADAAEHYARAARLDEWDFEAHRKAGEFAWMAGDFASSESIIRRLFHIADEKFPGQTPERGTAHNNLGVILRARGELASAEPILREAATIRESALGKENRYFAESLNNLALLLQAMGRLDEAEPLFVEALEIGAKTIGTTHPAYATHLNNLAGLLRAMGRFDEAEPLFRQALEIGAKTIGTTHPAYATHLNNLAELLRELGRLDEAEPLFVEALEILRAKLGPDHPNTKAGEANYADFLVARDGAAPE